MHKVLRIARREYLAQVKTKGFVIGLVLAPLLFSGSGLAMYLLRNQVDVRDRVVAVIDRSGLVAQALADAAAERNAAVVHDPETGKKVRPAYRIEIVDPDLTEPESLRLELSDRIRAGELHAFVEVGEAVLHPRADPQRSAIGFYAKKAAIDDLRDWVEQPINRRLRQARLEDAGVEPETIPDAFDWVRAEPMNLASLDERTGEIRSAGRSNELQAILVPLVMPMLMFLLIMMGAVPLLNAVMEEKSQRIAEVVLGSVPPFRFMMGKVLGGVAVSLTAATVYLLVGLVALRWWGWTEFIPYHVLPWFVAYVPLAIVMLGALNAALGSVCNDPSEAQSVMFPAMLPAMLPIFVLVPVLREPESPFATVLSLVPPFTPTLMVLRLTVQESLPVWQPLLGLVGVVSFALLSVWFGSRVFRVAILMQGTPPRFGNIVRWGIRG